MNEMFRGKPVIFDMDGVLINSMEYHCLAWREAAKSMGFNINSTDIYSHEGEKGSVSAKFFLSKNGLDSSDESITRILSEKERIYSKLPKAEVYPYIKEIISFLLNNGSKLAIVTGTSMGELKNTLPENISDCFAVKVTGDMVTHGKPNPEPYLLALEKLNITASESIVIENAPFGITSAKSAGLYCIALCTSLGKNYLTEADMILPSAKELYEIITDNMECCI